MPFWCGRASAPAALMAWHSPNSIFLMAFTRSRSASGNPRTGGSMDSPPAGEGARGEVEPIYETVDGWREGTARARSWADLPAQAIKYVRRLEELIGCPAAVLSTSPEREDTILMQNPFEM